MAPIVTAYSINGTRTTRLLKIQADAATMVLVQRTIATNELASDYLSSAQLEVLEERLSLITDNVAQADVNSLTGLLAALVSVSDITGVTVIKGVVAGGVESLQIQNMQSGATYYALVSIIHSIGALNLPIGAREQLLGFSGGSGGSAQLTFAGSFKSTVGGFVLPDGTTLADSGDLGGGPLSSSIVSTGCAAGNVDTDLLVYNAPANTLATTGRGFRDRFFGTAGTGNDKGLTFWFGTSGGSSVASFSTSQLANGSGYRWFADLTVLRTGTNTQILIGEFRIYLNNIFNGDSQSFRAINETKSANESQIITVKASGEAAGANQVIGNAMIIDSI